MNIKEMSSTEAIEASNRFITNLKNGSIKKRIIPNTGMPFDEVKVLDNFRRSCDSDFMNELAKEIYE